MIAAIRTLAITGWLLLLPAALPAQAPLTEASIRSRWSEWEQQQYHEVLALVPDRQLYLAGENMLLDLHLVEGRLHQVSRLSVVAYVELFDQQGQAIGRLKCSLTEGMAQTSLQLPADLPTGVYLLRGYTRWMRNQRYGAFTHAWVRVAQPGNLDRAARSEPGLAVFPEGGNWLQGTPTRFALKAEGASLPLRVELWQDSSRIQVADLDESGLGMMDAVVEPRQVYELRLWQEDTLLLVQSLEPEPGTGWGLRVGPAQSGAPLRVMVERSKGVANEPAWLVVMHRGALRWLGQAQPGTIQVPANALRPGVQEILLLNARDGRLLAHRSVLIPSPAPAQADNPLLSASFRDTLSMSATLPASSTYPLRLTARILESNSRPATLASLLDWQADLLRPAGLDVPDNPQALHTWLVFQSKVLDPVLPRPWLGPEVDPVFAPETQGHIVEGTITGPGGAPLANTELFLSVPGPVAFVHRAVSDKEGKFLFVVEPEIGQPREVIIRSAATREAGNRIELVPAFSPFFRPAAWPAFSITPAEKASLEDRYRRRQVAGRYDQQVLFEAPENNLVSCYGQTFASYRFADYTPMPTRETFREYLSQAYLRNREGEQDIYLAEGEGVFPDKPLMLIDGVPVFASADILTMDHRLVERVEIMNQRWYLNGASYGGVFHLITKSGDFSHSRLGTGDLRLALPLFSQAPSSQVFPPLRTPVLQGNQALGSVLLTQPGAAPSLQVLLSDVSGHFVLRMEGIDAQGRVVSWDQPIQVGMEK